MMEHDYSDKIFVGMMTLIIIILAGLLVGLVWSQYGPKTFGVVFGAVLLSYAIGHVLLESGVIK